MRRNAELNAFSDSAFLYEMSEGKRSSPNSDAGQISRSTSIACRERNVAAGRIPRPLRRDAPDGFFKIHSIRRAFAPRTSPPNVREGQGAEFQRKFGRRPSVEFVYCAQEPAELPFVGDRRSALRSAERAPLSTRRSDRMMGVRVTMAKRKTEPMTPRKRRAVSRRRAFSTRFNRSRSSADVISAMGRLASGLARSSKSHRFFSIVMSALPPVSRFDIFRRDKAERIASGRFHDEPFDAFFGGGVFPARQQLLSRVRRASSRASASETMGYAPKERVRSFPRKRDI